MSAEPSTALPRWDLTPLFPSLDSPEFAASFASVLSQVDALESLLAVHGIGLGDAPGESALTDGQLAAYEAILSALNTLGESMQTVSAYLYGHIATDSRHMAAQAKASELRSKGVLLSQMNTRFTAWLGTLDTDALIARSELARANAYGLRKAKISARHLMSGPEESLTAELSLSGSGAWARLHSDLTSQMTVELDGEMVPMSVIRATATSTDGALRKRAYDAELGAWPKVALPLAAAMNAIKYDTGLLSKKRGWDDPLTVSCFRNSIDRETLSAMLSAARKSFPNFRRYLKAKAKLISGADALSWCDLFAPVGESTRAWNWSEAEAFVGENFDVYSPSLGDFARRAFSERWVDAEPRPGKRDGAFCMGVRRGESRLLQNYRPSFDGVSTLAHELGHAYHNHCLRHRSPSQSDTPMTLAETASIFCQTIITNAALASVDESEQLTILEGAIGDSCQVVVDITSRFDFESAVIARRQERELSVDELGEIMLDAQRGTYGDGLDSSALHPYMWAVKGHYYGATFYNYPYMFGLLFGLGLYARYEADPENFRRGYDDLLSRTGMADAATLAADFGIDIRDEAFWSASLSVVGAQIDRFVGLVDARTRPSVEGGV